MSQSSSSKFKIRNNNNNRLLIFVVIFSLIVTVLALSSYLWDYYRVVRDIQNFYWMARAQDPTLFPVDYLYITDEAMIQTNILGFHLLLYPLSLGYGLVFYLFSIFLDYIWLTKLSVFLLMTVSVVYLFKTAEKLRGSWAGVSLSLLFGFYILASPLSISIVSGLQRAFALPLIIVFLYYLIRQKYSAAAAVVVASALIYLPNVPPLVITYILSIIGIEHRSKFSVRLRRSGLWPIIIALSISGVFVILALIVQLGLLSTFISPETTIVQNSTKDVTEEARYKDQGATPLFIGFPFLGRAGIFDTGGDVVNFLVLLALTFFIYKTVGRDSLHRIPKEIWYLAIAGFIMYLVSLTFIFSLNSFALYLPSRYTRSTLFLAVLFFVGLNWVDFLSKFPNWLRKNGRLLIFFLTSFGIAMGGVYLFSSDRRLLIPTFWFVGLIISGTFAPLGVSVLFWLALNHPLFKVASRWIVFLIVGGLTLYLGNIYINILGVKTTNPSPEERAIYQFIATLPKNALLAGDPDLMTNIPLFSKRSVLFRELFPGRDAPFIEYFDAQYAETTQPILDFCQNYKVSYLVIDTNEFSTDYLAKGDFIYQPWNDIIVEKVADRSDFILLQLEPLFTSGKYTVIECDAKTLLTKN